MEIRQLMRRLLPFGARDGADLERRLQRKDLLTGYYSSLMSAGMYTGYQARPWPVERAVAEAYERLVWVYKAVEAIAGHSSRLPFQLKVDEDVLDDHPLYRVLNKRANPMETGQQFRKRLATQVLLSKRGAFVEVTKSRGGDPLRMDLLPPGRTYPVPGTGQDLISHYEVLKADGTRQRIETENVRWFREVHPLDPYCGVTPLEAAGLSVELDFFARLYNVAFLKNDGRPGGIVAIEGDMSEYDMGELRKRFSVGASEAGKLSVVEGEVSYVDVAARPRDMAYQETSKSAKMEILSAFGVGESVIGYAAERTFDNAEQELYNFWTVTMPPFLSLLSMGFDEDSSDDLLGVFDVSEVEVLQRAVIARREEARREYELGLITIDEYREVAGRDIFNIPRSRALWVPSGKTLVATSEKDQKILDEEAAAKVPPALQQNMLPPGSKPPGVAPGGNADDEAANGPDVPPPNTDQRGKQPPVEPGKTLHLAVLQGDGHVTKTARPVMRLVRPADVKAAPRYVESVADTDDYVRLEMALAAALTTAMLRMLKRSAARIGSPRLRKNTRHWVAEYAVDTRVGTKALDADAAVAPAHWQEESEQAVNPIVAAAATAAALALLADLGGDDQDGQVPATIGPVIAAVVALVGHAAAVQGALVRDAVLTADQDGLPIEDIRGAVEAHQDQMTGWAARIAVQAATATINGAREAAAQSLITVGRPIDKQWHSRMDELVRPTHREAHGQTQPVGEFFAVGDALLTYPGDPSGPPAETYNCRCRAVHRHRISGQFVSTPAGAVARFTRADREAS